MVLLIVILVLATVAAASMVIVLAAPATPAGEWVAQAWKDIYSFAYTEIGTLVSFLKYNAGGSPAVYKYSAKRLVALGLLVLPWVFIGVPKDWYQVTVMVVAFAVAGFLIWRAMETKT